MRSSTVQRLFEDDDDRKSSVLVTVRNRAAGTRMGLRRRKHRSGPPRAFRLSGRGEAS